MNASTDAVVGHLIPLRLIYLRDEEGILLPPDKCAGQLFIVQSESPTCFQHTKQCSVPDRRSNYTYSSYLIVLELWLVENKMALSCKPVQVVMCPQQFMLFMLLGKSCNQKWLRLVLMTGVASGALRHHYFMREREMLSTKTWKGR